MEVLGVHAPHALLGRMLLQGLGSLPAPAPHVLQGTTQQVLAHHHALHVLQGT